MNAKEIYDSLVRLDELEEKIESERRPLGQEYDSLGQDERKEYQKLRSLRPLITFDTLRQIVGIHDSSIETRLKTKEIDPEELHERLQDLNYSREKLENEKPHFTLNEVINYHNHIMKVVRTEIEDQSQEEFEDRLKRYIHNRLWQDHGEQVADQIEPYIREALERA